MSTIDYEQYHESKTHGRAAWPYTTYICTIPLDFPCVPTHWHEDMEIVYIKKGCGTVSVDLHDYTVAAPCIVLIAPGSLHSIDGSGTAPMEYENIIFSLSLLNGLATDWCTRACFLPLRTGEAALPAVLAAQDALFADVAACIDAADAACSTMPAGWQLAVKAELFRLFYTLYSRGAMRTQAAAGNAALGKIKQALRYVEEHYAHRITIAEMAQLCCFSTSHFMKFFKTAMGVSFVDYLNDYRLSAAARRLVENDDAIITIAENSGFENVSYFNRCFKKKYGVTPRQFRTGSAFAHTGEK